MADIPTGPPITHENLRTPDKRRAPQRHRQALASIAGSSIPSPNYSSRNGTTVTGVVIHSAEGLTDANALGQFFANPARQASSHVGIDDSKTVAYVDPQFEAWTLRNGNPWTDNAEMCAFAAWTRDQWLAHPGMLQQAAEWVAERCKARNVPPRRITAADIKAGRRSGYFAHWDYTLGTGDGTHWDVGSGFPWDTFDGLVQAAYNGTGDNDMTPEQDALLRDIDQRLRGDTARPYDMLQSVQAIVDRIEQRLIVDPGTGSDRLRDIWGELEAIRGDLAKLTPPAKP